MFVCCFVSICCSVAADVAVVLLHFSVEAEFFLEAKAEFFSEAEAELVVGA